MSFWQWFYFGMAASVGFAVLFCMFRSNTSVEQIADSEGVSYPFAYLIVAGVIILWPVTCLLALYKISHDDVSGS